MTRHRLEILPLSRHRWIVRYEGDTVLPGCVWGMPPWQPPPNGAEERRRLAVTLRDALSA